MDAFIQWFQSHDGYLDTSVVGIAEFPLSEGGRGMIALEAIPEGHTLFTIPRSLTLSTRTSQLPVRFGLDAWRQAGLHKGWAGLILCMMWEQASGTSSKWQKYLDTLPTRFDTPMFWDEDDLAELKGTSVVEKLAKSDVEIDYAEKVLPVVNSRPDLFRPEDLASYYTLEVFHIMGSRILSRSFVVEKWDGDYDEDEAERISSLSLGSGVNVSEQNDGQEGANHASKEEEEEDDDDDDDDDSSDIAMVPMADILNARYKMENAKLFYEKQELRMVSTKPIEAGQQIWNTYGDLPNAELLRRYGHVDLLPLPSGGSGNPGDIVEIRADLVVSVASDFPGAIRGDQAKERIDWWLEEGGEDVFIIDYDFEAPQAMISFAKLMLLPRDEWEKVQRKSRPPKPQLDGSLFEVMISIVRTRLFEYPTTLQDDQNLLGDPLPLNKRQALIVRIGEKTILRGALEHLEVLKEAAQKSSKAGTNKRKAGSSAPSTQAKKSRK